MPSALHLVPRHHRSVARRPVVRHVGAVEISGCRTCTQTGALPSMSGPSLLVVLGVLAAGGTAGALIFAQHKIIGALGGSLVGIALLSVFEKVFAAPKPKSPLLVLVPTTCPDGTPAPGGNISACGAPKMGNNDPDAPPGGWVYNAPVASVQTVQQAAAALAAVNPCLQSSEQLVRNFQAAAGLAQLNASGDWNSVSPPGTDGRYGGDAAKAMAQYVQNPPPACYSNANPGSRPAWWGAPSTFSNGSAVTPASVATAAATPAASG